MSACVTVFLDSVGSHLSFFRSRRSMWKQDEDTALIWWFIESEKSSMMPRLRTWSVGVVEVPSAAGHQESPQAEGVGPRRSTSVLSILSLR